MFNEVPRACVPSLIKRVGSHVNRPHHVGLGDDQALVDLVVAEDQRGRVIEQRPCAGRQVKPALIVDRNKRGAVAIIRNPFESHALHLRIFAT
ncbi:hypothetical protein B4100_3827 [Heyndrickxia coagulans]|nr:hypothetical protein B4100_3827 [Heyndrickxia coagulans]